MRHLLPTICALSILATGAAHGHSTATAAATCTIVPPLQIQSEGPLAFGAISVGPASGGTVTIQPTGERSSAGAVILQPGAWGAARFRVNGEDGSSYTISLPSSCVLTSADGGEQLVADGFVCTPGIQGNLAGGEQAISVGATLHVEAGQPVGLYTGSFDVTVGYQ